jgi:hypothetical protein
MPRGRIKPAPLVVGALTPFLERSIALDGQHSSDHEREAITLALETYIHAWFSGDVAAMEKCLHPDLTARLLQLNPDSDEAAGIRTFTRIQGIQASLGSCTHPMARRSEIAVLDISGRSASARAVLGDWVAYVHLSHTGERWAIVNVMWEWRSTLDRWSA